MAPTNEKAGDPWAAYYGPNLGYLQEQYENFLADPQSVGADYRDLFERWGEPPAARPQGVSAPAAASAAAVGSSAEGLTTGIGGTAVSAELLHKAVAAGKLVWNIRTYGHLAADIDPLGISAEADVRLLEPEYYGITAADLAALPTELVWDGQHPEARDGWAAVQQLRQAYTGTIAFEFSHVHDEKERKWLNEQVEFKLPQFALDERERRALLTRLLEAEQFEDFLHRTFVGQKRFSVEGTDALVPLVDEIVRELAFDGAKDILMGMAHRGRLNVLAHVLGKPYSKIFSEFHHSANRNLIPSEGSMGINYGWTGDVKYHLGANRSVKWGETVEAKLTLANNPSHLEFVNPVVEGFTRAAQDDRTQPGYPVQDVARAAAVLMHGDAAFPGEGIVAETLNFNQLTGYRNGGTIHIIVNNRLGFTTESKDSRSTHYASDLAKGFEIPIVHVNADDPEACLAAARLAIEYRHLFKKDFLIDLIGYRRYGHNESDDPETTQPLIYAKIRSHPTVSMLYAEKLIGQGLMSREEADQIKQDVLGRLREAYDEVKQRDGQEPVTQQQGLARPEEGGSLRTGVSLEKLREINAGLLSWPESFHVYPKLQKILERRATALNEGEKVDWGHAETLAFASILADGKPIRISGQDVERATFAHRNLVLHDVQTGAVYSPLHQLPQAKASFAIYNSPLSEASVLGFEYGYNVYAPETLVIWEAQYGDFTNAAQVTIDQFITAGRSKWSQKSSLIMLLPHGYEGQGPEHSSARLERFLQLSGEDNWMVANLTTAAQYFHLLRRQALLTETDRARPLVLMAPKSLIRNPRVASDGIELSEGAFRPVLEQRKLGGRPDRVERIILCTGKIAVDLEEALDKSAEKNWDWLQIIRTEQLYPFPEAEIRSILAKYPNVQELMWVQEEPRNMGAWSYMEPRIRAAAPPDVKEVRYAGRPERSSPASGYQNVHSYEQQRIVSVALSPSPSSQFITTNGR
ncbi:2-oxoglutarate dehydrogenase E1 component [Paenibacillus sp. UNCCL117]|uniref:2-oxoglutarate dehydrogenase E1 component n=1 Tax=unclassified Paenibacillus TaxID=185978 RepID=UPI00088E485A|nr:MULTISPECIES: 2-oxoglutarate dehydrogenase E1 component [unclassified Paenibacillus]SDD70711.1 2-oxoglutarate dehydrogenase E1 component [Paenibacillus sp. cl123]SFW45396.1 2-oxoglutarate dehydrogenase E1 component [Paenibacillus sp. UNCCL117]